MGSKAVLFLCLLAVVLMVFSEVTARDLAETNVAEKTNGLEGYNDPPGYKSSPSYCPYGCCGNGSYGSCRCCSYAGQAVDAEPETKPQN